MDTIDGCGPSGEGSIPSGRTLIKTKSGFDCCLIIHGCPQSRENIMPKDKRWMNWLEDKLQKKGLRQSLLVCPRRGGPHYLEWKKF